MAQAFTQAVDLARRYCRLIEVASNSDPAWLVQVAETLPRLQAALVSLDEVDAAPGAYPLPDLDACFELYRKLVERLGDRDRYCLEFDQCGEMGAMTGSLAADLSDLYWPLKQGLQLADTLVDGIRPDWPEAFPTHWGRHLIDAHRQLMTLAAQGRLAC